VYTLQIFTREGLRDDLTRTAYVLKALGPAARCFGDAVVRLVAHWEDRAVLSWGSCKDRRSGSVGCFRPCGWRRWCRWCCSCCLACFDSLC
jgi:hypothetical protein